MAGIFSSPKAAQPPAPTPPPPPPTDQQAAAAAEAAAQQQSDARRAAGISPQGLEQTDLTGGGGVPGLPPGTAKTLLGQ